MQQVPPGGEGPLVQTLVLVLASFLFSGVPLAYLSFALTKRFRLKRERALLFGALAGAAVAVLLMLWLGNAGGMAAFFGMVGWFYGAWYGGKNHLIPLRGRPLRHNRHRKKDVRSPRQR